MFGRKLRIFSVLLFIVSSAGADWRPYTVQPGETLGSIARRHRPGQPLWGPGGAVQELFEKNRSSIRRPDLIFAGKTLLVPENETSPENDVLATPAPTPSPPVSPPPPGTATESLRGPGLLKFSLSASLWDRDLTDKTTGASGTARSDAIWGLDLDSVFPWSPEWAVTADLGYRQVTFAGATNREIDNDSAGLLRLQLGVQRNFERFDIEAGLRHEQLPLVVGISPARIGFTKFNITSPYLGGSWRWTEYRGTEIGLGASFAVPVTASNDDEKLKTGWNAGLSLPLTRRLTENMSYGFTPFANVGAHETETVRHVESEFGLRLEFLWR